MPGHDGLLLRLGARLVPLPVARPPACYTLPMPILDAGVVAPDFAVTAHTGETVRLADLRGKPVVLWFYPAADTPG